jgi:hypothetical protein
MAGNYNYKSQFSYSHCAAQVNLFAKISIGATGAPTIVSGTGTGISSIVRNSAGDYTINLSNPYNTLLGVDAVFHGNGGAAPAAPLVSIKTDAVATASAPAVEILCTNSAGTATDPANGETIYLSILLNRSSLAY